MAIALFANNANSTLSGGITNVATTLSVQSGAGALFPSPSAGQYFVISMLDAATKTLREIMWCTSRSGDVMTVVRAQEGTTALAWSANDYVTNLVTAGTLAAMYQQGQGPSIPATGLIFYGVDVGAADSMVVTTTNTISSYIDGQIFEITPVANNLTATPVINICAVGSRPIVHSDGTAVIPGEIVAGAKMWFAYDGNLNKIVIVGPTTARVYNKYQQGNLTYALDTGTADALAVALVPAITTYGPGGLGFSIKRGALANLTSTPTINVNGLGNQNIVRSDGSPIQPGDLSANSLLQFEYDGTNFKLLALQPTVFRVRFTGNTTFYIATTGSDTTGTGSVSSPWATMQHAFNVIYENYDLAGYTLTIQVAAGTYTTGVLWDGLFLGQIGPIYITGNPASPGTVIFNVPTIAIFHFRYGANIYIAGFRHLCGVSGTLFGGIMAEWNGYIYFDYIWFDVHTSCHHMYCNFGTIQCFGHYWIYGAAVSHYYVAFGGTINISNAIVVIIGSPSFSGPFHHGPYGYWYGPGLSWTGAFIGQRYLIEYGGFCNTGGGGVNFFPGSIAGVSTTGYYI